MKGATSIQERLWELRKDKGLNLEELSKLTGISKSALGSYEKEDFKEINNGNLITLADFYGVSVDYLRCRTENREQINTPLKRCIRDRSRRYQRQDTRINCDYTRLVL